MSKRVLIFSPGGLDLPGGVTRMVRYFTEAWAKQPGAPDFEIVDSRGSGSALWSPFYLLAAAAHLVWRALQGRVLLAHVNYGGRLSALRKSLLILLAAWLGIPIVLHLHGGVFDEFYRSLPRPLQAALRTSFGQAARIIVLGQSWRKFVIEELRVPAHRVVVLPNAVPAPTAREERRSSVCCILFLGELSARKGVPELLAAFTDPRLARLDWSAVVAGNGDVNGYSSRADALGIAHRVTFPGWVDHLTAARLLRLADILVLPSHGEGLPMSILEAMSHKLAIVTTSVGSIGEAV